ncbi:MAG TPA: HEAT repeat domain-containing protein [Tepidisphaeraceae bacterium]|jgi:HEAT repeat protein|nr:HEAT repeat domain-containing protein [Tepidisphaeraceae bacterium]
MLSQLVQALVVSKNEAADEVLLEAMRAGNEAEKALALNALFRRGTLKGLTGVVEQYSDLPNPLQTVVRGNVKQLHQALRECSKSTHQKVALAAIRLIAAGKQGKLTYILAEGLHGTDDFLAKNACDAIVELARWAATLTRKLQRMHSRPEGQTEEKKDDAGDPGEIYEQLMTERPEIEYAVARAIDVHRGKYGAELLRAALLLADWPLSKTLAILHTPKHGGQSAMVRRLQQTPDSEHVEAFLLGASQGGLRSHFGAVFSHIAEPPVLDALLRRTHWLKDGQLQICMHQVARGVWWDDAELTRDLLRRDDEDAARIGEWISVSGMHDVMQDERLEKLRQHLGNHFMGRLRLLRLAMRRPKGASMTLLKAFLLDPDERLARLAVREIVRRRPADFENMLIKLTTSAPDSVRRVISRAVGQVGFENFWERWDRLDGETRKAAGRAMLKVLSDGLKRLERKIRGGALEQRIKAISIAQELGVADSLEMVLTQACADPNPKLRSKAVAVLAEIKGMPPEVVLEKALNDVDPRVRANAIEVLEAKHRVEFVPLLASRARSPHSRERANAIKALASMRVGAAAPQLISMMQDERAEHRISGLWALREIGVWNMINEVGKLAKADPNLRVRRYAMTVLRSVAEMIQKTKKTGS